MDFVEIFLDEIALEGLDGITLPTLWKRVILRPKKFDLSLDDHFKTYIWNHLLIRHKELEFFRLPTPRIPFVFVDRFSFNDEDTGVCIEQVKTEDVYPIEIVHENKLGIRGSCSTFKTRMNVTDDIRKGLITYNDVIDNYSESLVIVASQKQRNIALLGIDNCNLNITNVISDDKLYCFLERIGRSRWQGALTFGNASINTAFNVKPANAFPLRKKLKKYQLITVQFFCMKPAVGISCISGKVLLLARFHADHTPIYLTHLSMICSMLASEPNKTMMLTTAKEKFAGQIPEELFRKLSRLGSKYIRLELRPMREWFPDAQPKEYLTKGKGQERMVKVLKLIQPFVNQDDGGDDDEKAMGDGDDEDACADMDCYGMFPDEFKYPVYLDQSQLSTCYRMIDESGCDGVKGSDFIKRLNIAINDFRTLWRNLERRQCFGSIKVEEGKHRIKKLCLSKYKDFHQNQKIIMPDRKSAKLDQSMKSARCSLTSPPQNSTTSSLCSTPVISYPLPSSSFEPPFDASNTSTPVISKQMLGDLSIISDVIDSSIVASQPNNKPAGSSVVIKFDCSEVDSEIEGVSLTSTCELNASTASTLNDTSIIKPSSITSSKTTNSTTNSAAGSATQSHNLSSEETLEYLPLFTDSTSTLRNLMRVRHIMKVVQREMVVNDLNLFKQEIYNAENEKLFTTKCLKRLLKKLVDHKKIKVISKTVPEGEFTFYCDLNVEEDGEEVMKVLNFQLLKDRTVSLSSEAQPNLTTALKIPPLEHRPKFGKAKMVHTYLWSLVYGYNVTESYDYEIPVWLKQVQKIDPHINRSVGWCSMTDAIDNMPLSVFIESILSCSPFDIKGLEEHTSDPCKLHAKLHDVPTEIVRQLTKGRKYLFKFQCTCEVLLKLGLLSFTRCALVKKEEIYMYVHKMASLYDNNNLTTSSSLFPVTDVEGCMMYDFQSLMDIDRYWMALQTLSLDVKSVAPSKPYQTRSNLKEKFRDFINGKDVSEVSDVGFLPGDRLGPGGTDSSLFANLRRNWSLNTEKHVEPGMFTFGGNIDRKPIIDCTEGEDNLVQACSSADTMLDDTLKRGPNAGTKQIRKRGLGSGSKSKQKAKKSKTQFEAAENMHNDSAAAPHSKQKRKLCYDEKDEEALRRMTRQRVSWSNQEDRVILLCSLTNLFLGNTLKWIVNSTVVRDILHHRLESSRNKTAKACLRRKNYLLKKEKVRKNVCVYQAELMHDKELCKEFKENKTYSIYKAKENAEAYIACLCKLEIKFGYNTPDNLLEDYSYSMQLPDTIEELCSKYTIFHPSLDIVKSPKEINHGDHVLFSTLQNLVHSIALLTDKTGRAHELYQMLSGFSSKVLTPVFKHMIAVGIFTRFRPHKSVNANKVVEHQNIGCYQLSQRYQYIWLSVYPKNVFQKAYDFHASFEPRTHDPCHGSKFMNLLAHSSSAIGLCSLLGLNLDIKVKVTVPAEIVVIDSMEQNENDLQNNAIKFNKPKNNKYNDENDDDEYCNDDEEDDDDADMQDIKFSTGNSRTFLYWYRCQYTHSKTSKFIDSNNSIFINACQVKVKLPSDYQTVFHSDHKASWVNFYLALDEIKDWNNKHDYIHSRTCQVLLKHLRLTIPGKMDVDEMMKKCKEVVSAATANLNEDDASQMVTSLYNKIKESSILGTTLPNLLKYLGQEKKEMLIRVLKVMQALCLVVRVGIEVFKYVTFDHIEPWAIKIKKNLKGRGVIYNDRPQFNFENVDVRSRTSANNCPNSKRRSTANQEVEGRTVDHGNKKLAPVEEDDDDDDDDDDYGSSNKVTLLKLKNCIMKRIITNTQTSSSTTNSTSSKLAGTTASSPSTTTTTTSPSVTVPAVTSVGQVSSLFNDPSMSLSSTCFTRTLASDHIDTTDSEIVDSLYATGANIVSMAGTRTDVNTENVSNAFVGDGTQIDFLISQMPNPASQFCASYNNYSGADVHAAADNTPGRKRKNSNSEERETLKLTKLDDCKFSENIHNTQRSISSCIPFNTTCHDNISDMNTSFAAPTTSSLMQSPPPCFTTLTPVSLSSASSNLLSRFTNHSTLSNKEVSAGASSTTSPSFFSSSAPMISSLNTLSDNKSRARLASVKPLNSNDLSAIIDMFKNVEDTNILSSSSLLEKVVPTSSFSLSSAACNRTQPSLLPASVLRAPSEQNIFQSSNNGESDCTSFAVASTNTLGNSNSSSRDPITERIMQFDGANDDDEQKEERQEREEEQEDVTAVDGASSTSKSRHSKRTIKKKKQIVDSGVRDNNSGPSPKGTYKIVRVIPRPWKTPEGTVNRSSLASMLEAVCLYIAERPGVSTQALTNKYHPVLQPVAVLELLEMLDILGVTIKSYLKPINKPSLFSRRKFNVLGPHSNNLELEMNFVTADFMIKIGQFFNQLHANKRTDDDDD